MAFDGGGGHVTSGASGGVGRDGRRGAGRRGQKGWGTSGAVIGGRYTGVHEANFEDRNQQNLSSSLSHVRERGASENAPGSDASSVTDDDDGARDSARKGNAKETRKSRLGPSQSFAYQGPVDDFDPHRSEREEKILNAEDEEEKARLGLPTSFVRLSQKPVVSESAEPADDVLGRARGDVPVIHGDVYAVRGGLYGRRRRAVHHHRRAVRDQPDRRPGIPHGHGVQLFCRTKRATTG